MAEGYASFVGGGSGNTASGDYSAVGGGRSNTSSGSYSTVGGGLRNTSSGSYSTVGGGYKNTSLARFATVSGGYKNTSAVGSVSSGINNEASGAASVVAGGGIAGTFTVTIASPAVITMNGHGLVANDTIRLETTGALPTGLAAFTTYHVLSTSITGNSFRVSTSQGGAAVNTSGSQSGTHTLWSLTARNVASGNGSVVGGGTKNTASALRSTVSGGQSNIASGSRSTVGGGIYNNASGYYGFVGGGYNNTASGYYSTVGGGNSNIASGSRSTVGGGQNNTASSYYSTVGGGRSNTSSGSYSTVGGGRYNTSSSFASAVVGGRYNTASGYYSVVVGGGGYNVGNIASGKYGFVGAGKSNTASGKYASIPGGTSNTATHQNVFLLGSSLVSEADDTTYVENLRVKGGFNTGVTLGTNAFPTGKVSIRSAIVNLKTVAETTIFTVPSGYMFLIDTVEVVTTSVTGAAAAPTIQFGNTGDSDAYYGPTQVTSNAVGARHISENPQDGAVAGTVITMGVTVASTATAHSGVGIVTGYLLKTS
jgi:hypothetical protein